MVLIELDQSLGSNTSFKTINTLLVKLAVLANIQTKFVLYYSHIYQYLLMHARFLKVLFIKEKNRNKQNTRLLISVTLLNKMSLSKKKETNEIKADYISLF